MSFPTRLNEAIRRTKSVTCVGLDPRKAQLPAPIRDSVANDSPTEWAAAYTQFCCEIIDVVKDLVPCVKPQAAFFEQLGPAGMVGLGQVIAYASQAGLIVITDGKRNDIGSTAAAYADAYLGSHGRPAAPPVASTAMGSHGRPTAPPVASLPSTALQDQSATESLSRSSIHYVVRSTPYTTGGPPLSFAMSCKNSTPTSSIRTVPRVACSDDRSRGDFLANRPTSGRS